MKRKKEKQQTPKKLLFAELRKYEKEGLGLYLEGKPSGPDQIASACLREKKEYMRDFISDDQKHIQKVDFIRLS